MDEPHTNESLPEADSQLDVGTLLVRIFVIYLWVLGAFTLLMYFTDHFVFQWFGIIMILLSVVIFIGISILVFLIQRIDRYLKSRESLEGPGRPTPVDAIDGMIASDLKQESEQTANHKSRIAMVCCAAVGGVLTLTDPLNLSELGGHVFMLLSYATGLVLLWFCIIRGIEQHDASYHEHETSEEE